MRHRGKFKSAFTLVELLVAIGIIVVLASILLAVASKVKIAAHRSATGAQIAALQMAIEAYHQNFNAYPGPLSDEAVCGIQPLGFNFQFQGSGGSNNQVTQSENLVLGLMGGLDVLRDNLGNVVTNNGNATVVYRVAQDGRSLVYRVSKDAFGKTNLMETRAVVMLGGSGAGKLMNSFYGANDRTTQFTSSAPKWCGLVLGGSGNPIMKDSVIPEIIDSFPEPMPILYYRAHRGSSGIASDGGNVLSQYDARQNMAYVGPGTELLGKPGKFGHGLSTAGGYDSSSARPDSYRYNLTTYMASLTDPTLPRAKDSYVLIAAGVDRVYGTDDDQTSFGSVRQ